MTELCGLHILTDDLSITCNLTKGHDGFCTVKRIRPYEFHSKPYHRTVEVQQEDPDYRYVSRGDGIYHVVPAWVADALEKAGIE